MINYSIVIPHKNCPELLERLLKSIPKRDDLEVIVVDDHSDDKLLPNIGDYPQARLVYNDKEPGAGNSRNKGIELATGKWLLFADADDYYVSDALNSILEKYKSDCSTDIVYLNAKIVDEKGTIRKHIFNQYHNDFQKNRYYSEQILKYLMFTPWSRMVKREMIISNNICFENVKIGNDAMFGLRTSLIAKTYKVESIIAYLYYRPQSGSLTQSYYTKKNLGGLIDLHLRMNVFFDKIHFKRKYYFGYTYLKYLIAGRNEERNTISNLTKLYNHTLKKDIVASWYYAFFKVIRFFGI